MIALLRKLIGRGPSEIDQLIIDAIQFGRYRPHTFKYKDLNLEVTDFVSVAYQLKEYFVDGRMDFKCDVENPKIIDCGANVGVSIIRFKKLFPKAIISAYEADAKVFDCLQKNLASNGIQDVSLINKAVWVHNDGVEFGIEGADGGSVFHEGQNKVLVPSIRLKDVISKYDRIDLLKMDIEGAESDVLLDCGDAIQRVKYLFVEYHSFIDQPQRLNELLELFKRNGFRFYIHSIGSVHHRPFVDSVTGNMDIQLDIHAIRN